MSRVDELRKMDQVFSRLVRLASGRVVSRTRAERSGVTLSSPAISILAALSSSGPLRLSSLAQCTGLEAPLISREIRDLADADFVVRNPDPTDGRASIVELTTKGTEAWTRHRAAADAISAEVFAGWSTEDLRSMRELLERMARDVVRVSQRGEQVAQAG